MKILCEYTPAGPSYVRSGWGRVLRACGHNFLFWDPRTKSAFDVFSEFEPDAFFGCTYSVDRAVAKCIAARPSMKAGLFASAWGPYLKDVDLKRYPLVVASEQEKARIEELKRTTGKPDFVFIHAHGEWLEGTMSGWAEIGVPYLGVLNAADTFVYLDPPFKPELACDVGYVGGRWGYKSRNIDRVLLPLCHPSKNLDVKIFSRDDWGAPQCLGTIDDRDAASLFASATVCPNVSEPHSTDLGWDVVERPFKVAAAGGLCVSDFVGEASDLFGADLPMYHSPTGLEELVRHFVKNPESRVPVIQKLQRRVLTEHTYWERVAQFWNGFGMPEEAKRCLETKARFVKA